MPVPNNLEPFYLSANDLWGYVRVQQLAQQLLGQRVQLMADCFIAVRSDDIEETSPVDVVPPGTFPNRTTFDETIAVNVPWRLRQIEVVEVPAAAGGGGGQQPPPDMSAVKVRLVGGGCVTAANLAQEHLFSLQHYDVSGW